MVCRGMTLIAAALIERRHEPLYQLATSASNPCDMGRSIELTALAHRKHYRAQQGLEHWLRMRFDTIPVSKERYQKLSVPAQKVVVQGHQPRGLGAAVQASAAGARGARSGARGKADRTLRAVYSAQRAGVRVGKCADAFRGAARERARTIRLRAADNRLVGLLDQHSHPCAAQVVLSADRRHARVELATAPRISPARDCSHRATAILLALSASPTPKPHGDLPDRRRPVTSAPTSRRGFSNATTNR